MSFYIYSADTRKPSPTSATTKALDNRTVVYTHDPASGKVAKTKLGNGKDD